jgi:hypothetical protein
VNNHQKKKKIRPIWLPWPPSNVTGLPSVKWCKVQVSEKAFKILQFLAKKQKRHSNE